MPIKEAVGIYKEMVKYFFYSLTKKKAAVLETEQKQKQKISEIRRLIRDLREVEEKALEPMEKNLQEIQENFNSIQENVTKFQKQMEQKDEVLFLK
eukprot:g16304.t1